MYSAGPNSLLILRRRSPPLLSAFAILCVLTPWRSLLSRVTLLFRVLRWARMFGTFPLFVFAMERDWPAGWLKPEITSSMAIPRLNRALKDREALRCAQPWLYLY